MRVLIVGGTGQISTGIVKHLQKRGAEIVMYNRGQRESRLEGKVRQISGDRNEFAAFEGQMKAEGTWDAVIDMICFRPEQAESDVRAFSGRCKQFIFCSTVCTYGVKIPGGVVVDETFAQEPISTYGKDKVACEKIFRAAEGKGAFAATIIRPSHTYGEGNPMIDNLEGDGAAWDRIEKGLPVLCAGDGMGLWVSTHRDDVGKLFAYACLNQKTYGQAYNATREENFTWRDYYRQAGHAMGREAKVLFMPAEWIVKHDPRRFGLLREITQYHGAYTSEKARRDVPEFVCEVAFEDGAGRTIRDAQRRGKLKPAEGDAVYDAMVEKAMKAGIEPVIA